MDADKIFVGRKEELEQFKEVLEDEMGTGKTVITVYHLDIPG